MVGLFRALARRMAGMNKRPNYLLVVTATVALLLLLALCGTVVVLYLIGLARFDADYQACRLPTS